MRCTAHGRTNCPAMLCQREARENTSASNPTEVGVFKLPDPYRVTLLGEEDNEEDEHR